MDLGYFLLFLIVFGLISYVIEKIWGINPYKLYGYIGIVTVIGSLLYIMAPVIFNSSDPNSAVLSINRLTSWFIDFLPGALIGDTAGIIIGKFTGDKN